MFMRKRLRSLPWCGDRSCSTSVTPWLFTRLIGTGTVELTLILPHDSGELVTLAADGSNAPQQRIRDGAQSRGRDGIDASDHRHFHDAI
jgi:hypothetical protein